MSTYEQVKLVNEQVAREVMGWDDTTPKGTKTDVAWYGISRFTKKYGYMCKKRNWQPYTRFDDAFAVVEKLKSMNSEVTFAFEDRINTIGIFHLQPSDICKEALSAVRGGE